MNLRGTMHKLQTALCHKGFKIQVHQQQSFSERSQRMVTKYVLKTEKVIDGKRKNVTILETYQQAEVVAKLAEMYGGG